MLTKLRTLLVCTLALLATTAYAQTTRNVPAQYPTIQAGINAAVNGDTVLVAPGTYYENIDFKGKAITVTSSAGAALTIIDGGAKIGVATVQFVSGEARSSVISNMTIRNGGSASFPAYPEFSGGIYAYKSAPTILNNIITANQCSGVTNDVSSALIQGNTISATIGNTNGDCVLDKGEAVLIYGYNLNFGSGIVPTVLGNLIENNVQGIYGETGGIYLWSGDYVVIQGNTFHGNNGTQAGDIVSANTNMVSILQNVMYGSQGGAAGAISLLPPEATVGPFIGIIAGNTIADNTGTYGNTYLGNSVASQVYLSGNLAQYVLVNNIIVNNAANMVAINCDVGYSYLAITPLVFDHNDIYAGPGGSYGGSCPSQTGGYGNISQDPLFTNAAAGDYSLRTGSPAIDTGNNSAPLMPASDFAGASRIQDATGKGYPVVDMGAYETSGQKDATPTILTLTPSAYPPSTVPIYYGSQPLTFTSTITSSAGTPSGPVTIYVDGVVNTTVNVPASGTLTYSLSGITPGLHAFTSTYPGSGIFPPAISVKFYLLFPLTGTTLMLTSSPNPSIFGNSILFTITASATDNTIPTPVTLTDTTTNTLLGTLVPNSAGVATYSTSKLAVGYHNIQAAYAGTSTYTAATASVYQDVVSGYPTTTALICNPTTLPHNTTSQLSATVTSANGTPTGSITFTDNGTALTQVTLSNAAASLAYLGQVAGAHTILATYVPTGSFAASSATCLITVQPQPTVTGTLTAAPEPSTFGSAFSLHATLIAPLSGPALTGMVAFSIDGSAVGSASLSNNTATLPVSAPTLAAGLHQLTATWPGDSTYSATTLTGSHTVTALPTTSTLTVSPISSIYGTSTTLTAAVVPTTPPGPSVPAGTVTFYNGSAALGTATLSATGVATLALSTLPAGLDNLTCTYSGSSIYAPSNCNTVPVTIAAAPTALTITSSLNPAPAFTPVTFTMQLTVNGQPAGAGYPITLGMLNSCMNSLLSLLASLTTDATGTATFTTSSLPVGSDCLIADYAGDANHIRANAGITEVITAAPIALTLTGVPNPGYLGQTVTFNATVGGTVGAAYPAGTIVTFLDAGTPIGTAALSAAGIVKFPISTLAMGTHPITTTLPATGNFSAATSNTVLEVILGSDFTIALAPPAVTVQAGQPATVLINLGSIGNFSGPLTLTCGQLPSYATATIAPTTVTLTAGGSGTAVLTLTTAKHAANDMPTRPGRRAVPVALAAGLLLWLLPVRRRRFARLMTILLAALALQTLTGCTNAWYELELVTPGTYQVPITATDMNQNARSATLSVTVTP